MNPSKPPEADDVTDLNSLDTPSTIVENNTKSSVDSGSISAESLNPIPVGPPPKQSFVKRMLAKLLNYNVYLLLFVLILFIVAAVIFISYSYSKRKEGQSSGIATTGLSQATLDQLANSDVNVGNTSQVLTVQSSAVFAGKLLARSDLEVAGNLQLGGSLNLPDINVSDTATVGQLNASKNLSVSGNTAVQGLVTVGQSLQVAGSGTFNGNLSAPQVSTNNLMLNNDLTLTHHIVAGGSTPGRTNGGALGSGGTATVSGSDTAGSVTVNTGSSPGAGCFITINFAAKFQSIPHILLTPASSAAASVSYYVNRGNTNFSICTASTPPANSSLGFDYFVVG